MKAVNKILLFISVLFTGLTLFCGCGTNKGEFVWLDEAYENEWLSQDDLKSIAYYYNLQYSDGEVVYEDDFTPLEKAPSELDEKTRDRIRAIYCKERGIRRKLYDEVSVMTYYGTYQNCVVVEITTSCMVGGDPMFYPEYELGGVKFYNYHYIGVYREIDN